VFCIFTAKSELNEMIITATITRANGTVEDVGIVSYHHKSWLKTFLWKIKKMLRGVVKKWQQ
jgi:hypothetical protein